MFGAETINDLPPEQRRAAHIMLLGVVLCFTILAAPVGLPLVLYGRRKLRKAQEAENEVGVGVAETDTPTETTD